MKLHFAHDIDKDIENFINGTRAVNSKKPTKFQIAFSEKYGENFEAEKVKFFIEEQDKINSFDASREIVAIEKRWKIAEPIFIEHVEKIFNIFYPAPIITVYLTHNERCTYNIEQNYFFVRIDTEFSNNTIMHELLHFYTWHAFGKKLIDKGLSKLRYNDIKESLTELLNLEFSDLLNGKPDTGYPQHQEIRSEIRKLWQGGENVEAILDRLAHNQQKVDNFLKKDSFGNWNTIPPTPVDKIGDVNCHRFVLYVIGKISWDEMVSDANAQRDAGKDFIFGEIARKISDIPFLHIKDLESLALLANKKCEIGKVYVGQILDAQNEEMAHSFIVRRELNNKYICFDKPGFKYPFEVSDFETILNFVNKDGEKSYQNQKWRFVPINMT